MFQRLWLVSVSLTVFVCAACTEQTEQTTETLILEDSEVQLLSEMDEPFIYFFDNSYLPIDYEWEGLLDESYLATIENVRFKTRMDLESALEQFILHQFPVESSADMLVKDIHTREGGACNAKALKLYSASESEWRCTYRIRLPYPQKGRPDPATLSGDEQAYWLEVVKSAGLQDLTQLPAYLDGPNFELDLFEIEIVITDDEDDLIESIDVAVGESGSDQIAAAASTVE